MNTRRPEPGISIVGMGLSPADLTARHLEIIQRADVLIAGNRHLEQFSDHPAQKIAISRNIAELIHFIQTNRTRLAIVVLASGDPLFHGIGSTLIRAIGAENIRIYPNISSICGAFAAIGEPWHDARVISLHGRSLGMGILNDILLADKIAILTDPRNTPARIAGFLVQHQVSNYRLCILERLGAATQSINWFTLEAAANIVAADPNIVILKRIAPEAPARDLYLGMPDSAYEHEAGMITKPEIRAVSIACLRLLSHHVVWDLGAGSGSVAIEAGLLARNGIVFAVEQKAERAAQIRLNIEKFGVRHVFVKNAVLPDAMDGLPLPDRIFIGGGGNHLEAILNRAAALLKPDGIIVINTVLLQSLHSGLSALRNSGFMTTVTQVQTSSSKTMPWGDRMVSQNPVWIISGTR